jgi:hypothetical protein
MVTYLLVTYLQPSVYRTYANLSSPSHLVDIFAMVSQNVQRSPSTFSGKDARISQYQNVLANLSSSSKTDPSSDISADNTLQDAMEWQSDDEDVEVMKSFRVNRPEKSGPLLGGFADIGTSMR